MLISIELFNELIVPFETTFPKGSIIEYDSPIKFEFRFSIELAGFGYMLRSVNLVSVIPTLEVILTVKSSKFPYSYNPQAPYPFALTV